jgi:hypothetical protein
MGGREIVAELLVLGAQPGDLVMGQFQPAAQRLVAGLACGLPFRGRSRCEEGVPVAPKLRVLDGGSVPEEQVAGDPWEYQVACADAFVASWRARGFSAVTIDNDIGLLERALKALGRPAWEMTPEDIDRVVGDLATAGRTTATRREYVQIFKGFHRFLQALGTGGRARHRGVPRHAVQGAQTAADRAAAVLPFRRAQKIIPGRPHPRPGRHHAKRLHRADHYR